MPLPAATCFVAIEESGTMPPTAIACGTDIHCIDAIKARTVDLEAKDWTTDEPLSFGRDAAYFAIECFPPIRNDLAPGELEPTRFRVIRATFPNPQDLTS